ncbi:MAG: hypothetical protein ACREBW_02790 [Candidatus Micrarchaeaceae archaeon]
MNDKEIKKVNESAPLETNQLADSGMAGLFRSLNSDNEREELLTGLKLMTDDLGQKIIREAGLKGHFTKSHSRKPTRQPHFFVSALIVPEAFIV